jgi:RNA polymerase sigma-70 factor (ECF subfamily)
MIYRWCRRAKLQPEDAADVVQEVLAAVAKSVGAYQPLESGGGFRAWLWGITRHRLLDFFRRLRDTPQAEGGTWAQQQMALLPGDPESSSSDASAPAKDPLWHKALELVRAEFEPNTWQAFWHVAVDGRRPADVAQDLGMTVHAVYQAKARVLRKLRTRLAGLEAVE